MIITRITLHKVIDPKGDNTKNQSTYKGTCQIYKKVVNNATRYYFRYMQSNNNATNTCPPKPDIPSSHTNINSNTQPPQIHLSQMYSTVP